MTTFVPRALRYMAQDLRAMVERFAETDDEFVSVRKSEIEHFSKVLQKMLDDEPDVCSRLLEKRITGNITD